MPSFKALAFRAVRSGLDRLGYEVRPKKPKSVRIQPRDLELRHTEHCRVFPHRKAWLSSLQKGGVVAEAGVAMGEFSADILALSEPSKLYLIDPWTADRWASGLAKVEGMFEAQIRSGQVEIRQGLSTAVLRTMPGHSLDLLYLDSAHTYEVTRDELAEADRVVKPAGRIAGHDYCDGAVVSGMRYGVIRAVNEFCLDRGWTMEAIALEPTGHFTFCIVRASD